MMRLVRLVVPCLALLLIGCGRTDNSPPPNAPAATAPASPRGPKPAPDAPGAATTIPDNGDPNVTVQRLTQALRDYVVRTRSVPKTFEDFAAKAQITFPEPPAGKKYAIQRQAVVLVKR
jgi:hypothetical protein